MFQVERHSMFSETLCDVGGIMYHGQEEQKTDAKTRSRRQYINTRKQQTNETRKTKNNKRRQGSQPYENVGREPQKSSQGSRGWVPSVTLIRKTTGQSDPECNLTAPI